MEDRKLRRRQDISAEYKWKLTDLYETDEQWNEEVEKAKELCTQIQAFAGTLGQSAKQLLDFSDLGMSFHAVQPEFAYMPTKAIIRIRQMRNIRVLLLPRIRSWY